MSIISTESYNLFLKMLFRDNMSLIILNRNETSITIKFKFNKIKIPEFVHNAIDSEGMYKIINSEMLIFHGKSKEILENMDSEGNINIIVDSGAVGFKYEFKENKIRKELKINKVNDEIRNLF